MIARSLVLAILMAFACAACDSGQTRLVGEYSICWTDIPEEAGLCRAESEGAFRFSSPPVVAAGYSASHIGLQTCGPDGVQHYSVERDYTTSDRFEAIGPLTTEDRTERQITSPEIWPDYSHRDTRLAHLLCGEEDA
ncbi:hypothetical protein HXX25_10575 [Hyphobacterium sp. CCMP332]|jgi:hypothetical protein|uniref:hypothetical protein n=1 Tax=Hyphobacterium sp. CCMP332 TaxID=2749086 RepID=UPI00164FBC4B|nr:hypothetical protein [Hyphobacterium sp. CCMP332]QNL19730.1 hypothetical protein HXX25_10575 [Hyphobacterium sp. CCMP332]